MQDSATGEPARTPGRSASDQGDSTMDRIPPFGAEVDERDHESLVVLSGELDLSSAPQLRELLAGLLSGDLPVRVVLDLSNLVYLDSTGLSVLVTACKRATATGSDLAILNPNSSVRRLFQITALDQFFTIIDETGQSNASAIEDGGQTSTD
jgi:anti-sigma B factor antagonist